MRAGSWESRAELKVASWEPSWKSRAELRDASSERHWQTRLAGLARLPPICPPPPLASSVRPDVIGRELGTRGLQC